MNEPRTMDYAAEFLKLSRRTVEREANAGYLRTYHVGRRRFTTDAELQNYVANKMRRAA